MRKLLSLVCVLSLTTIMFAGCGTKEEAPASTPVSSEEVSVEASVEEPVVESSEEVAPVVDEKEYLTYEQYVAAANDDAVSVATYVQAKQSYYAEKQTVTVYSQAKDGAYFLYNMSCSAEDYEKLVPGTKIYVDGYKTEWSGEVEIESATFTFADDGDTYVAEAVDVTDKLGLADIDAYANQKVSFKGLTVEAANDNGDAFLYNYDGSGSHDSNSDLYFNASINGQTYTFTVESFLCGNDTDVYAAVEALNVGDVIDLEGFLYYYNGIQPHITNVTVE